jgi:hypothetical protein
VKPDQETTMSATNNDGDGRLSFKEAVAHVMRTNQAAFAAAPVFGERTDDEEQTAEGARIFIVEPDGEGDWRLRFIAGPFFSNAYAANEIIAPEEIPDSVRELRYMATRVDESWYDEQIQVLIQKLVKSAGIVAQMPDYESVPTPAAGPEAVFPISFIGRDGKA